ncbi:MAG: p-aminobenzoyl-glutamate transporter AbgT [Desulforhopalus sp.]|jgi:p-aminobenzoyl-glutamate transporter AbgT
MDKFFENIPDIWYDFYARFIPGFTAIVTFNFLHSQNIKSPKIEVLVYYIILGYIIGHIIQPSSAKIARKIQYEKYDNEENIKNCRENIDASTREAKLLSKQHSECVCFVSLSILTALFIVALIVVPNLIVKPELLQEYSELSFVISFCVFFVYFIFAVFTRAHAVADRAKSYYKKHLNNNPPAEQKQKIQ